MRGILLALSAISLVTASDVLYPYGTANGDTRATPSDDKCEMTYNKNIQMFQKSFTKIFVCTNGVLSLDREYAKFKPQAFPLRATENAALIAPFWADTDLCRGGNLWSRITTDQTLLQRASKDVRDAYQTRDDAAFSATWILIATWEDVRAYKSNSGSSCINRKAIAINDKTNTFQAVIASNGKTIFAMFHYKSIEWIEAAIRSRPAQVGFDSGDGIHFYSAPNSQTPAIIDVDTQTNVGIPGKMVFKFGKLTTKPILPLLPDSTKLALTTTPTPTTTPTLICKTRNFTVTLYGGKSRADVEVFSGKWGKLRVGRHEFTDISGGNCTVIVNIVRSASSNTTCPDSITKVASSDTKTATVEIPSMREGAKLELPIGKYTLNIPYDSAICNITINVVDPNIRRRVTFQADYDVKCDQATASVAKAIIFSTAQQHFEQIKELCGKYCKPIVTRKPIISCSNDKLRIQWPTDPVYGGEMVDIKPDVNSALKLQISGITLSTLTLVVPSKVPPVVYPVRNSDGDSVAFSLMPFCMGNSTYNSQTDRCP